MRRRIESVLVTGGTGTFGQAFVRRLMDTDIERIAILSRGEHAQEAMRRALDPAQDRLRFFIGDVRDFRRLMIAFRGVDTVIHAAALKVVPTCEYNPIEALKTNALGAANVVEAAILSGVTRVVALSSDKGAAPLNAYGATKLAAERVFLAANAYGGNTTRFICTRYGNVAGSQGSVIPLWRGCIERGEPLPVTDREMTRFWMTIDEAVELVLGAMRDGFGGEVVVPDLPAYRLADLATAIAPDHPTTTVGIRPGEKLHEVLYSEDEARGAWKNDTRYMLLPREHGAGPFGYERVDATALSSATARRLDVESLRTLVGAL